jgi:uncharacterized membrane protein
MFKSGKFYLSSFNLIFRFLIAVIFLIGLMPAPVLAQENGTIAGQVTDNTTSVPIVGATIGVLEAADAPPSWYGNTDTDGNYSISVPEGTGYLVAAGMSGYVSEQVTGQSVTANATTTVNFSLSQGGIIQGVVTDNSTGESIQSVDVWAYKSETPEVRYDTTPTTADGGYGLAVPPGTGYTVEVNKQGYSSANQTGVSAALGSPVTVNFSLVPDDNTPPANINDLVAGNPTHDSITLTWTAPGDDGTTGTAAEYDICYATSSISDNTSWNNATPVQNPPIPSAGGSSENFTVGGLSDNTTYFFAIKTRDDANLWSGLSNSPSANTTPAPPTPRFTITNSQNKFSFMLGAGDNITETFNITSVNDFAGTVNLDLHGPPDIENSSSLSPTQIALTAGETKSVTLTLAASAMTPSGTYQCGLEGQTSAYGGQQKEFFFTVIVGVAGQPLLSASPAVVAADGQTNFFASQFAPNEDVTLKWDSGPKAGETLATGQIDGNGTWQVQVTIPADMPGGNFRVEAISASSAAVFELIVTSGSGPDFIISSSPEFISIEPGHSGNVTIYVSSVNGFSTPVTLTTYSPPEITCNLSTSSVTPPIGDTASTTLTITVAEWASPNMFHINVEGNCADPAINKMTDINLDIPPPADWGPGISLSQSYAQAGDTITVTGSNFPPACQGENVTIKEAISNTTLQTTPATITVNNGSFTGTFTIPSGIPSGNYRIKAIVAATQDFAERDFQIMGTDDTYTLSISPQSITVATEAGGNSASTSVNLASIGGNSPSVNLDVIGAPSWLDYRFGSLPVNTAATGDNSIPVPAGGSTSRNLTLTVSMTAPSGTYSITIEGWENGQPSQAISLELTVQPPAGFGMAQLTLSPTFGENGRTVNFSGSGFTNCDPARVIMLKFGELNIIVGQNLPTINVPQTGDSAGKFSGTFRVPSVLPPGTYPVKLRVGEPPDEKFVMKSFTITGGSDTFVIQASPQFLWAEQGSQIGTMIKVQAVGSSSANVSLSVEGCPADITASFTSVNVTAPPGGVASTDLNLDINEWMPSGHYTLTVMGQRAASAEQHRIPLEIDVVPPAGFGMASIYLNPTVGSEGTWITISGSGFQTDMPLTHLYFGPPNSENDYVANLPSITTDSTGALSAVLQVPAGLTPGMYPVEVIVGTYPDDKRAMAEFTLFSDQASFNINLSPMMIQAAPGSSTSTSVNVQSVGTSSANVTFHVEGPPNIEWRFDGGAWQTPKTVSPPIGSTVMSSLEIQPKASTPMGHYSLAVKAIAGEQQEIRNLELDVGASADYGMPIFSLNPNTGTAGTNVSFSGSNFPANAQVLDITFGGDNITLAQSITTSPQGSFSGSFTVPGTVGGQPIIPGSYMVGVTVATNTRADANFNVYGDDDTFTLNLSPNFLQGEPGGTPSTSGILRALSGATPTVKLAVRGLPPGVETVWNGTMQSIYVISAPPGGQNNFELTLNLPGMIPMGQYPAMLEGWVDTNSNDVWDDGEDIARVNLELSIMPPQGYGMGMLSLSPTYGQVGDTVTFTGSGFPPNTAVTSLVFAETDVLTNAITTSDDGSFSGLFTVPSTAFGMQTGPGMYPVDITVGTYPHDMMGFFDFQVITSDQKFSVSASPHWLVRPAGDTAYVNINVRSLVTTPPSPNVLIRIEGLPRGVTPSFTTANVTPPVGDMESRELRLTISDSCSPGNYPISIQAYNAAAPTEELWSEFALEITPSSGFMEMGMATLTVSPTFGSIGDQITVSGYGFPSNQNLTQIRLGPDDVTPTSVNTTTDATGAFSAVITVPSLPSGTHPLEVNVQNTIRMMPFNIMSADDTFSLKISPSWLEPIPAGDPNGRQIAITVDALTGKTPTVSLSIEGLFAAFGTIEETWNPASQSVNVTSAGGAATAVLTLKPSENIPPGPYPFVIVGVDGNQNRREFHMELHVGPPMGFMGGMMGMNQGDWNQQWEGTEWEHGVFFPEVILSPKSAPAGTQVSYTGTNLPAGANVTSISFAGQSIPLPSSGLTADSSGGFSGSFIVNEAWNLTPGMYGVEFHAEKDDGWSQYIIEDFNLMRSDATFSLEATPDWIPPIPPGSFGQTQVNVKALGYTSVNVTLAVVETFGGGHIPGGAQAHWGTTDGPGTANATVPAAGQTTKTFYLEGDYPGFYMITIVGWIDSDGDQVIDDDIASEFESAFHVPLDFEVEPPQEFKNWDKDTMMSDMGMANDDMYLFYFPEITLNPNMGKAGTKVSIKATDFPGDATVTRLRFAGEDLPVPSGTAADSNGDFTLVFNVPKTMWGGDTPSGWYDVEVEAQNPDEPPVFIMKPFQVTASDVAFTLRADPDWLPPIPPGGNGSTLIRVRSMGYSANVTLSVDKIPPGIATSFSSTQINVPPGGSSSSTLTLTPTSIPPGHYGAEIKGVSGSNEFYTHIEFDVEPPMGFMNWDRNTMMSDMGMQNDDMYLFYFPEITLNPNMGKAGTKVTIKATDFPAGANVTRLRFAGMNLPIPTNTAADNVTGDFTLVFNVPKTMWGGDTPSGWYDVEVEAQKPGEPSVFIMKPFQVTASDVAFTLRAEPDWLPPIPPSGSSTTIRVKSMGESANVTLSVDKIPPGIATSFSSTQINVPPGGSSSSTLTLTPTNIPPGHYGAEIKGVSGSNEFYTHLEFEVEPPQEFMDTTWMTQQGIWFPEITLNPNAGPVKTKVSVKATDFPAGSEVTHLRFAGRELPVPDNTTADSNGDLSLVFNVPGDYGIGHYMVEVEAQKTGMPPVFIAKPFFIEDSGVSFKLDVVPGFIPGVAQGEFGNTTVFVKSTGQAVTVDLYVDGLPPGVTGIFDSDNISVAPGGSGSTKLTITTRASTPPGHYPLTIRGVSGSEVRMMPFGFGVTPPAAFKMPEFTLEPDFAPAGYTDKKYKVTFTGTGFPADQRVASLEFGSQPVAIPDNLSTDAYGNFNGVFQMPTGLAPGTYDVMVAVETLQGGYVYDSRPFSIRGADAKVILKPSPPYLPPIVQGGQGTTIVNVRSVGTTTANVTLYVDGLAPGISADFTPSNVVAVSPGSSSSATLTLGVSSSTPPGPYPLSIRGISGNETAVVPLGFGVMPDIGGGEGHATITINPPRARPGEHIGISGAGFTNNTTITLTAAPPGAPIPIDITPGTIQVQTDGTWASEITVPEAGQVPPGTYIIKATDGVRAAKSPFSIVPASNADFFLNVSPPFIEVVQGESGNTTMTLSSKNGFSENVVFSVGHLVPGVTATFKDTAGNTISKFTGTPGGIREVVAPIEQTPIPGEDLTVTTLIDVDSETPIGPYDIALEAGSGTVYRAIPLGLMVTSPGASMNTSPMSGPADTDIRLSGSGFTAGETVTVTFAGNNITTIPTTVTAAQDGTFTATITAPDLTAGIHPVSVTGATSGISIDRPFGLKPSAVDSFVLYASPQKVDIPKGGSSTITLKVEPLGSFQSPVALSVSGLSEITGATSNISPSATITPSIATPTTATLTFNVPAGASEGRYPLVITGTSGAITQTRKVTVKVVPPVNTPDFSISLAPNTVPISPSSTGNTTVTIAAINGFSGTVNLAVTMSDPAAEWPSGISSTTGSVTPSAATGLGKKAITFTVSADTLPGSWAFKVTGTSGALEHNTEVMVICTPSGTTVTPYASPRLDPTTITDSTPVDMEPPWGDKITINGLINDGSEASVITPAKLDVTPDTLGSLPEGASDMLGRITNVESSAPVDGVEWDLGFPFDSDNLTAAGFDEENLKVAYLNPDTGTWTEVTTTVDTTNKVAYASPDHFSSWTLIATPAPPPSTVVTVFGGGGGGGATGVTSLSESITSAGRFVEDVTAESVDGKVELGIPKNTIGKNRTGRTLYNVSIKNTAIPSAPPADTRIIGAVYDIGPDGATFDPPISLTFNYSQSQIPDAFDEVNLIIATWRDGAWVELEDCVVDPNSNTITVPVSHFTIFTLMAHTSPAAFKISAFDISPAVVKPGEKITISATVTNTGDLTSSHEVTLKINNNTTETEVISLAGHTSQQLTFTIAPHNVGDYAVDINGLSATFIVREATTTESSEAEPTPPEAPAEPSEVQPEPTSVPAEAESTPPEAPETPSEAQPVQPEATPAPAEAPAAPQTNLWLIIGIVAGGIVTGIIIWRLVAGIRAS